MSKNQVTQRSTKYLILGSNGFLGANLSRILNSQKNEVISFSHSPGKGQLKYDFSSDEPQSLDLRKGVRYIACICAAQANIDACKRNPELSHQLNIEAPGKLLRYFTDFDVIPVYYSTDNVFDGFQKRPYSEQDAPSPINLYGSQKWATEKAVAQFQRHLILRMSKVVGNNPQSPVIQQTQALRQGQEIRCAIDQSFSPVYADDISNFVQFAVQNEAFGTYHLAQDRYLSRFDQGIDLAERLGVSTDLVKPLLLKELPLQESRPLTIHLNNEKAKKRGFRFTSYDEMIRLVT